MICISIIVVRVGFLVLKLQWDFKKYPINVMIFLVGFENLTTIFPFLQFK